MYDIKTVFCVHVTTQTSLISRDYELFPEMIRHDPARPNSQVDPTMHGLNFELLMQNLFLLRGASRFFSTFIG